MKQVRNSTKFSATGHPHVVLAGYPVVGLLPFLRADLLGFFSHVSQTYGDVIPMKFGRQWVFLINHPDHVEHVFLRNRDNYVRSKYYEKLKPSLGRGLFTLEGEPWLHQRRTAQPAFSGARLREMVAEMAAATQEMTERWERYARTGEPVDITQEAVRLTLDIVLRTLFGAHLGDESETIYRSLTTILKEVERRVWAVTPIGEWVPTHRNREFRRAIRSFDTIIYRIIDERLAASESRYDLLSMLIEDQNRRGWTRHSRKSLRDQVTAILVAGHETGSNTLAWSWYELAKQPAIENKLHSEIDRVIGDRIPTFEDLMNLHYTRMVFQETLRVYPSVWTFSRMAVEPDRIGDIIIPKHGTVMMCAYTMHRHPDFWPDPEIYDPEHFAEDRKHHKYAYFPFGGGTHLCLGNRFGTLEGILILAMVGRRFSLARHSGEAVKPEPMTTLRPHGGIRMTIHRRSATGRATSPRNMAA